jgi:hypothetical protein
MTPRPWSALVFFALAVGVHAASLEFDESSAKASAKSAEALDKALSSGVSLSLDLKNDQGLEALLGYRGSYQVVQEKPGTPKSDKLTRSGPLRVLLVENSSSVTPLSKGLLAWGWRLKIVPFVDVEKEPGAWLDPAAYDVAFFSSPGWWQDFANPPSGPSRMPEEVVQAARKFVSSGGAAVFFDIAQWDLEKIWPKSFRLANLGPYRIDDFKGIGGGGKLALAPFGVAVEKLYAKDVARLFYQDLFPYPDGSEGRAEAGYAFPDPGQGTGFVAGFAFHPFEQDDTFGGRVRRALLNLMLVSGQGSNRVLAPAPTPTLVLAKAPTPVPTQMPTRVPTQVPTKAPAPVPTRAWTPALPSALVKRPTPAPTAVPTAVPTKIPTLAPTFVPTKEPTPAPTPGLSPALVSIPVPTAAPVLSPVMAPAQQRIRNALGCLQSSPEPFSEGGTYIFFCLSHSASARLRVFDSKGNLVFTGESKFLTSDRHQWFYAPRDDKGKLLKPGRYHYRVEAQYDGQNAEWRQGDFNFKKKNNERPGL